MGSVEFLTTFRRIWECIVCLCGLCCIVCLDTNSQRTRRKNSKKRYGCPTNSQRSRRKNSQKEPKSPRNSQRLSRKNSLGKSFISLSFSSHRPFGPPPGAAVVSGCHGKILEVTKVMELFSPLKVTTVAVSFAFATSQVEAFE